MINIGVLNSVGIPGLWYLHKDQFPIKLPFHLSIGVSVSAYILFPVSIKFHIE